MPTIWSSLTLKPSFLLTPFSIACPLQLVNPNPKPQSLSTLKHHYPLLCSFCWSVMESNELVVWKLRLGSNWLSCHLQLGYSSWLFHLGLICQFGYVFLVITQIYRLLIDIPRRIQSQIKWISFCCKWCVFVNWPSI